MTTTNRHDGKYALQWWSIDEIKDYAKDKGLNWSDTECREFLEEHEEEICQQIREVGDELIDNWLYDIKSDLDDAVAEEEEEEELC